jgi:hypothetical protein
MIDEAALYRIVGSTFLASLPAPAVYLLLPARTIVRKRIRWIAAAYIGIGTCFVGLVLSWPGPNLITDIMMLGGLTTFFASSCCFLRSLLVPRKSN